ncbi:hypothetical protein BJ165DRAFT_180994 [Panaeolus papilionaceus]|nr:hypothetical protein BJ165DRAFT_180994 [Panaeolus papilionaceus]
MDDRDMASSSSRSPVFPLEIFHLILQNLSYHELIFNSFALNIDDLRQCSLVCRAWAPICQAYLFKSINMRSLDAGPARGTIRAIAAHPKIASYIQSISYTSRTTTTTTTTVGDQEGHIPDQIVSTLLTLPNLHSVTMKSFSSSSNFHRLCAGDLVLFRLWEAYKSSTSLEDLTLYRIRDAPLTTVLSFPYLKSLTLWSCCWTDWQPQPVSTAVRKTSKIESLKILLVKDLSYAFLSFLPYLKKLSVREVPWRIPPDSKDQLISIFRGLEKFTFDYGGVPDAQLPYCRTGI